MSRHHQRLHNVILLLNSAGLLGYLYWLVFGHQRILYTQNGVLYLLPCLPFAFVYLFLVKQHRPDGGEDGDGGD